MRDLNLLYVFEALWRDRSVTIAAENLGLTQAAVSSALKRLREEHEDKLFVLVARRMEPTPKATAISTQLLDALALIRKTGGAPASFDPANSNRLFTIRTRDAGEVVCLPHVLKELWTAAPHLRVRTVHDPVEETLAGLATGRIDLALGFTPSLQTGIRRRKVLQDRYVCVVRNGHPLSEGDLTLRALLESDHLVVEYSGTGHDLIERALIDAGARSRIKVRLPQYLAAAALITETDLLWCVPETLALSLAPRYGLVIKLVPLDLPGFEVALHWHERFHRDPGNVWMRNFITGLLSGEKSKSEGAA